MRFLSLAALGLVAACATAEAASAPAYDGTGQVTRAELEDVLNLKEEVARTLPPSRRDEFLPRNVSRRCILDRAEAIAVAKGDDVPNAAPVAMTPVKGDPTRFEMNMERPAAVDAMIYQAIAECQAADE
jgi:hypothetical protein